MYVARVDSAILRSDEVRKMEKEYKERFGEWFIPFNYADFDRQGEKPAAQIYKETLEKALRENKPYHIESKRHSFFDH
nr:MAG TPA: hypothetical protein [Caudoviricetes sp.]